MLHRLFPCLFHSRGAALPIAPSNLTATQSTTVIGRIDLAWTDNSGDETGFSVEQSLDGSTGWAEVATPGANATSAAITGLTGGTTYYFRIRANRSGTYSAYSSNANAVAASADSVILAAIGAGQWEFSAEDLSGADGTEVTAMTDRSGNGYNLVKQGATGPGLYNGVATFGGKKVIRGLAANQRTLYNTTWPVIANGPWTLTFVLKVPSTLISGSHGAWCLGRSGSGGQVFQGGISSDAPTSGQGLVCTDRSSNLYDVTGNPINGSQAWVLSIRRTSNATNEAWVNGVKRNNFAFTAAITTNGFSIMGSNVEAAYHNGDIARCRLDGSALSDANMAILHASLQTFYTIS